MLAAQAEAVLVRDRLELEVVSHDCDSAAGKLLDGRFGSGELVHKFVDGDGNRRGVHEGPFRWRAPDLLATGTMKGVTNGDGKSMTIPVGNPNLPTTSDGVALSWDKAKAQQLFDELKNDQPVTVSGN